MGIPSYYKKLADHTKGLVSKSIDEKPEALFFDFNCMIYHCARKESVPPYPGADGQYEWENALLEDIAKYVVKVWQITGQPEEVFLAIDGVVPMAKIKQQRLRRFKSVWLAEEEKKEGTRKNEASWDTNCITPGTHFMKRLTQRLKTLCAAHKSWSVSGSDEPGEGEHKIMRKLRQRPANTRPIVVYGLDADLILLTLLNAKGPAYLIREASEMGLVQYDSLGEEQFSYFSISVLLQTLPQGVDVKSYIAAMSLLGNDFLPHSLTVKIRDDGHARLCRSLQELANQNKSFLEEKDGAYRIDHDALLSILTGWAQEEETRMFHTLKKKQQLRGRVTPSLDNRPIEWMVEDCIFSRSNGAWILYPSWRSIYQKEWLQCERQSNIDEVCREFLFGLQWVLDYYTGQTEVDGFWCYSRRLPPLWCDLVAYLQKKTYEPIPRKLRNPIQPEEQLAMVLPLESWSMLMSTPFRSLPAKLPQFWPMQFGFFSVGRTRMWECEACIPILSIDRIRDAVKEKEDCGEHK